MGGEVGHLVVVVGVAVITIGALARILKHPDKSNQLMSASVDTFNGILKGLEP